MKEILVMRLGHSSLLAIVVALGLGCSSSEEPAAAESSGSEETIATAMPEPAPPAPAAMPEPVAPPPPVAEPPASQTPEASAPQMPPYAAIIIHSVKDYDKWRPVFDGDADARKAAGMVGESVMRGVDDDKTVAIYVPATDIEKVKAFMGDKALAAKMKEGGVKGKPTVYMFKMVSAKMPSHPAGDVYGAILKYSVKDFDAFKTAIEGSETARSGAGLIGWGIGQGTDKATDAYLYLQSDDAAKLKTYLAAKETKAAMKDAGAKGQPKTTLVKEVSNRMYQ
jgi:hypothetical protein